MGNTASRRRGSTVTEDHPHSHGEYLISWVPAYLAQGSPPLAWGIHRHGEITSVVSWDHPHSHGEYNMFDENSIADARITPTRMGNTTSSPYKRRLFLGSPPLAWGIPTLTPSRRSFSRITPTRMGNTFYRSYRHCSDRDHPHSHGEYSVTNAPSFAALRITPTRMGNTDEGLPNYVHHQDHPHSHGEYGS